MLEYPKWLYFTDGPQESYVPGMDPVLVQSQEEEDELMGDQLAIERDALLAENLEGDDAAKENTSDDGVSDKGSAAPADAPVRRGRPSKRYK